MKRGEKIWVKRDEDPSVEGKEGAKEEFKAGTGNKVMELNRIKLN